MTSTPILAILEIAPGQDQKEDTANAAIEALEAATQDELTIAYTANARTLSSTEFNRHVCFVCPSNGAAATLTVPLGKRLFMVDNQASTHQVTVGGLTGATVIVPGGVAAVIRCNGTDCFTPAALATTAGVTSLLGRAGALVIGDLASNGVEVTSHRNANNGYAGLDSGGRIAFAQLPTSLGEAWYPAGTWDASTNSPALASSTAPAGERAGAIYVVSAAGTTSLDGYAAWNVGDKALWDGTAWEHIEGDSTEVTSVAGQTGAVTLTASDISGLNGIASQTVPSMALVYGDGTILVAATPAGSLVFSGGTLSIASQAAHTLFGNTGTASASPGVVPLGASMSLATGSLEIVPLASHTILANTGTASVTPVGVPLSSHLTLSGGTLDLVNYGSANGIAGLGSDGYVPCAQMQPEIQNLPFGVSHPGTMSDGEVLLVIPVNQTLTIPTGLVGTYVILNEDTADVPAATTALIYASKHAGTWTNRGTLSVSTAGSLTITGGPTADVTLVPGDGVRIIGQATHDTGFKNFGIVTMLKKVAG